MCGRVASSINRAILKLNIGHVFANGAANTKNQQDGEGDEKPAAALDDDELDDVEITDDSGDEHYDDEGFVNRVVVVVCCCFFQFWRQVGDS